MYLLKKTRNLFGVLLILILTCSILASCTEAPDGGDNDTPQNGTEGDTPPGGETPDDSTQPPEEETSWKDKLFEANNQTVGMAPNIWIGIFAETSEIDVGDELPVAFLYRFFDETDYIPDSPFAVNTKIIMRSYKYKSEGPVHTVGQFINEQLINEYNDYFTASLEEYTFHGHTYEGRVEQTVVPAEWFSCDRGSIVLTVRFDYDIPNNQSERQYDFGGGLSVYYIRTGDTIKLFSNKYDFNNFEKE